MKKSNIQKTIFFIFLVSVFMLNINMENSKINQAINNISLENIISHARADSEGYCATSCTGTLCPNNLNKEWSGTYPGYWKCCVASDPYVGSACP